VLNVKNAILILAAIVAATCLFGQDVPSDKSSPPQHMDQRIRVSERVLNDMALKRVLPQPPWSKDKGHEKGEVTVGVLVDYDGTVKVTHLVSGDPLLGDVAENAVKQWQFRPFILNGERVQVDSRIVMKFGKKHAEVVVGDR
jgi:hypothetical protein